MQDLKFHLKSKAHQNSEMQIHMTLGNIKVPRERTCIVKILSDFKTE